MILDMKLVRKTKGTLCYEGLSVDDEPPPIKTIYIQRWALPEPQTRIRVVIKEIVSDDF